MLVAIYVVQHSHNNDYNNEMTKIELNNCAKPLEEQ